MVISPILQDADSWKSELSYLQEADTFEKTTFDGTYVRMSVLNCTRGWLSSSGAEGKVDLDDAVIALPLLRQEFQADGTFMQTVYGRSIDAYWRITVYADGSAVQESPITRNWVLGDVVLSENLRETPVNSSRNYKDVPDYQSWFLAQRSALKKLRRDRFESYRYSTISQSPIIAQALKWKTKSSKLPRLQTLIIEFADYSWELAQSCSDRHCMPDLLNNEIETPTITSEDFEFSQDLLAALIFANRAIEPFLHERIKSNDYYFSFRLRLFEVRI